MIEAGADVAAGTGAGGAVGFAWALQQYQIAWGWAITQSNTWVEVFDSRWELVGGVGGGWWCGWWVVGIGGWRAWWVV
jgi:hypothetical protein